ncbi:MAG: gliding motility-associated C-terminal domain-containing protein [Flavobacteriales bacterium]|jgi:gliding motility-associated-like protein|nr:gliding motility-associated C-terminal domain-containing protein [Flavobacteriales bacterium]
MLKRLIVILCLLAGSASYGQTSVRIPNVFTPGGDGINDVFTIQTTGYEELTCSIFNRHGEVVYRFYGLNGSWDGTTHGGVRVSSGTYFIYLELSTSDGENETRQGTLQVLWEF